MTDYDINHIKPEVIMTSIFNSLFKRQRQPLFFATDIHCHILPGIDDGTPDADYGAELVMRMSAWGLSRIIATPHVVGEVYENTPESISAALTRLQESMHAKGITTTVQAAAEHRLDDLFSRNLTADNIISHPCRHVLIENSFMQEARDIDNTVILLINRGYTPILAHPERFVYYHSDNLRRYRELHDRGLRFQVNLLSLAGRYGSEPKRTAERLIDAGMVEFFGTDVHRHEHCDAIESYLSSRDYDRLLKAVQKRPCLNDTAFNIS